MRKTFLKLYLTLPSKCYNRISFFFKSSKFSMFFWYLNRKKLVILISLCLMCKTIFFFSENYYFVLYIVIQIQSYQIFGCCFSKLKSQMTFSLTPCRQKINAGTPRFFDGIWNLRYFSNTVPNFMKLSSFWKNGPKIVFVFKEELNKPSF